jgi:hypothetical protein
MTNSLQSFRAARLGFYCGSLRLPNKQILLTKNRTRQFFMASRLNLAMLTIACMHNHNFLANNSQEFSKF